MNTNGDVKGQDAVYAMAHGYSVTTLSMLIQAFRVGWHQKYMQQNKYTVLSLWGNFRDMTDKCARYAMSERDLAKVISKSVWTKAMYEAHGARSAVKRAYKYGSRRRYFYLCKEAWINMQTDLENSIEILEVYGESCSQ